VSTQLRNITPCDTYVNGVPTAAGDIDGLDGDQLIASDPSVLEGPWGLPSRIWWQGQSIDIFELQTDAKVGPEPHVLTLQIGRAIDSTGWLRAIRLGHAHRRWLCEEHAFHSKVRKLNDCVNHPWRFKLSANRVVTVMPIRWLPVALQTVEDNMDALALGHHIEQICPHVELSIPSYGEDLGGKDLKQGDGPAHTVTRLRVVTQEPEPPPGPAPEAAPAPHAPTPQPPPARTPADVGDDIARLASTHLAGFVDHLMRVRIREVLQEEHTDTRIARLERDILQTADHVTAEFNALRKELANKEARITQLEATLGRLAHIFGGGEP